ncbi:hypothetical protein FF38_06819 [Lucilia cuprina]|uniref:ZAD domain-containing protein n=1 Tax=Lucilia cuprina TaxID=7375 RepID=A0A0L0C722_LUCCU|nr:hypothetical protein CVS40_4815 [Lucilia cuprina]KNC28042.1 hypothetical protein FF38_06819 [Lucilia cuprina]
MTPWGKICRICASPADYEIFANIPIYLHANCKDYLDWQKPINEMLEETTGLKVSPDDGLPKNICALCISYLKHAKTFREQAINTCLNFLAVKEYKNIMNDKKVWNYDEIIDDVASTMTQRNYNDDDNLKNNQSKEQNKVSKQLMSNTNINATPTLSRQIQLSLQYLSKLYDNNVNVAAPAASNLERGGGNSSYKTTKQRQRQYNKTIDMMMPSSSGNNSKRQNLEDDLPRTTSSDEYETPEEAGTGHIKNNIFSYKEKNFEEDDIMDLDELKDAITINIPSTCKEHKCSFCFKRFMFEESFGEHIKTCIEYKFATFLEEMNNLLFIRRAKEISPHEFIRRMIFSLRKTCEWLKENCIDTTLPDLLQNNKTSAVAATNKQRLFSETKSTGSSIEDQQLLNKIGYSKLNKTILGTSSPILMAKPAVNVRSTPINMSNNILHEIERSESRNSQKLILKKPIPILATSSAINTINNLQTTTSQDSERLAFMEKLQNAAKPIVAPTIGATTPVKPILQLKTNNTPTPLISVRQDLLANTNTAIRHTSPLLELLQSSTSHNSTTPVINPCARCPQCNLYFETLDALEIHNAMQHNSLTTASSSCVPSTQSQDDDDLDSEHKRIIALFEDDDDI